MLSNLPLPPLLPGDTLRAAARTDTRLAPAAPAACLPAYLACRAVLKEALARAEEQQRQQLRQQAEQLAAAHAEMTVRERAERLAKMDAVRAELNALEAAFQRRRWVGGGLGGWVLPPAVRHALLCMAGLLCCRPLPARALP